MIHTANPAVAAAAPEESPVAKATPLALSNQDFARLLKELVPRLSKVDPEEIERNVNLTFNNDEVFSTYYQDSPRNAQYLLVCKMCLEDYGIEVNYQRRNLGLTLPADTSCFELIEKMQKLSILLNGAPCVDDLDLEKWSKDPMFTAKGSENERIVVVARMPETCGRNFEEVESLVSGRDAKITSLARLALAQSVFAALHPDNNDLFEGNVMRADGGSLYVDNGVLNCGYYDREQGSTRDWAHPQVHTAVEFVWT